MGRKAGSKNKITLDKIKQAQQEVLKLTSDYNEQLQMFNNEDNEVNSENEEKETQPIEEIPKKELKKENNETFENYTISDDILEATTTKKIPNETKIKKQKKSNITSKEFKYLFED